MLLVSKQIPKISVHQFHEVEDNTILFVVLLSLLPPPLSLVPLKKVIYLCELVILILLNISWGHFQKVGGMSGILVSYTRDSGGEGGLKLYLSPSC